MFEFYEQCFSDNINILLQYKINFTSGINEYIVNIIAVCHTHRDQD